MPFNPTHGGRYDQIDNSVIKGIYGVYPAQLRAFTKYVNAYTPKGQPPGTSNRLTYDRYDIRDPNSNAVVYSLPTMVFIGYTDAEMALLDELYGAIRDEVTQNPAVRTERFFRNLGLAPVATGAPTADIFYMLRAKGPMQVGTDEGPARAVTAPVNMESSNRAVEIITDSTLLDSQGKPIALNSLLGRTEFFQRVAHEWMHESFRHRNWDVLYDANRSPMENFNRTLTLADIQQMDLAYGGSQEALKRIGARLQLSDAAIDQVITPLMKEQVPAYQAALIKATRFKVLWNISKPRDQILVTYTRAQLDQMVAQGMLKLKDSDDWVTPGPNEPAGADNQLNYKMKFSHRYGLSRDDRKRATTADTAVTGVDIPGVSLGDIVDAALLAGADYLAEYASETGQVFGSTLGRLITRDDNQFTQISVSTLLGVLGENFGQSIEDSIRTPQGTKDPLATGFEDFGRDLINAGIGALSSYLTAELFEDLGIDGTLGELGQTVFANQLTTLVTALAGGATMSQAIAQLGNWVSLGNAIGGWVGQKLASELVHFDTIAGQVGASIGSAIGMAVGVKIGATYGAWGGPIGAAIGAFVGFIVGGLIGSFFGVTPETGAGVTWNESRQQFASAHAWARGGAPKAGARALADGAAQVLNTLIDLSGAHIVDGSALRMGELGTRKKNFVYRGYDANGKWVTAFQSLEANLAINFSLAYAVAQLVPRMSGGDVYIKRAIARTLALSNLNLESMPALQKGHRIIDNPRFHVTPSAYDTASLELAKSFDSTMLLGNISTAQDYRAYLQDRETLDVLIAADPNSSFAAAWVVTLARAFELGLTRRSITDWIGGWNVFLDETADGKVGGAALTAANLETSVDDNGERLLVFVGFENEINGVLGDSIDAAGKDKIVGTSSANTIIVTGDRIANATGLTINGAAGTSSGYTIKIAAGIDGGGGNDTILGGDLGNDLYGGDGNDTLVGGKLDDWLFGDAGNDRLFAGAVANYTFSDTDAVAVSAALATRSNGDMLLGGEGDDILYGSAGSDWLRGGGGNDLIRGGAGGDIIEGGAGNDRGAGGEARLLGGGGTDQYVFGYGDGWDVAFDEADGNTLPGSSGDSVYQRIRDIDLNGGARDWVGGGQYEINGSIRGGEDAVSFGPRITMADIILRRSGTTAAPGQDLIIQLTAVNPTTGARSLTGDVLEIRDWFEATRRVEWFRFANGEDIRIGDLVSFTAGSSAADVIIGTNENDFLYGGDGNDTIFGLDGDDFGLGGGGNDLVSGDNDNDWVAGGTGNDVVIGGAGNDTVFGDANDDRLIGGAGSDILVGGLGDDEIFTGAGNDIIRFQRGDGRDTVMDDLVDNWELVWQNGTYVNGYTLNQQTGVVTKEGVAYFDGSQWSGIYDYDDAARTLRRHRGAIAGSIAANNGADYLEFGVGVDIQDLLFRRNGNDLQIAVTGASGEFVDFDSIADRITVREWYTAGNTIENFVFAATGTQAVGGMTLAGAGTDAADTLTGTSGADWITGNGGDDTISGDAGNDVLAGNAGNDVIRAGAGTDVLYGGSGDDLLEGGLDGDVLVGGAGVDIASYANSGTAAMRAYLGASYANTREGVADQYTDIEGLEGTSGADRLGGDAGDNVLRGLAGNDVLLGGAGDDIYQIDASHGQDTITDRPFIVEEIISSTNVFNSALYTATWTHLGLVSTANGQRRAFRLVVTRNGTGEEVYRSRDNVDFLFTISFPPTTPMPAAASWPSANNQWSAALGVARTGNASQTIREVFEPADGGVDEVEFGPNISLSDLTFSRPTAADLRITYGSNQFVTITNQTDALQAIEYLTLRDGLSAELTRIVLVGETAGAEDDFVVGDANANTLDGFAGDDVMSGGAANDTLRGGDGDDILEGGAGGNTLDGGSDSVTAGAALNGAAGSYGDTIRYVRSTAAVTIDLAARTASGGHAASDIIVAVGGVSTIENVTGSEGFNDILRGDARANVLVGLGGNDTLEGRAGNDVLIGGLGADTLSGGDGEDNLAGEDGNDTLNGGNQDDLLAGGEGDDILNGDAGADLLTGGDGADVLRGGTEDDSIGGDAGNDQLFGDAGADHLAGGEGNDTLSGGDGDDTLEGEAGNDSLAGDVGSDTYVFDANSGVDTITDAAGANVIQLAGVRHEQVWLTRSGNDLRIGVIGGTSLITVQGFYAPTGATLMRALEVSDMTLFLAWSQPLIDAMTAASAATPDTMPATVGALLGTYWFGVGAAGPVVANQVLTTNEDTALNGTVGATDPDNNITGYALGTAPTRGTLNLNTTTGAWTYTPNANVFGADSFTIVVTDAEGNKATQGVALTITSVNDAPTAINSTGLVASIDERDHPISGATSPAIVLATLTVSDPDAGDTGDFATHAFTVSDPTRFEVVGGQLRLRAGVALDYETATSVSVNVTATDRNGAAGGLSVTRTFTFAVNDRSDYFYGGASADTITGTAGVNLIFGNGGNDTLSGAGANDTLDGGDGNDTLNGLGGADTLSGQIGDDVLDGGAGNDTLRGGDGVDTLRGGDGDDALYGDSGNDTLQGGLGIDILEGGDHNDRLEGGDGNDTLRGQGGDDTLVGGLGGDRFNGGAGVDTVTYAAAAAGVTLSLTTGAGTAGEASGDVFEDAVERIIGSAFADTITGSAGIDYIDGGAGNDVIYGGAGDDVLLGGDGNDTIDAQSGDDTLDGGLGSDILIGGLDNDTYRMDGNSGADEIRNFDPNGADIDVVGYDGIVSRNLWFEKSGNDLTVTAVGTSTRTTIKDWYATASAGDRANYKIDFFLAGVRSSNTINAEALVNHMAGYTRPTTIAAYDALHANSTFESGWQIGWNLNQAPTIAAIAAQTINEDGSLSLALSVNDDITPRAGLTVTAQAVNPANYNLVDTSIVNPPTVTADGAGNRTLTVGTQANRSGQTAIKVTATDAGGLSTTQVFLLFVTPVADAPTVSGPTAANPTAPATIRTFDGGAIALTLDSALVDTDGSETLEIRISGVPTGLTFNQGSNVGGGIWSFTRAQLAGLLMQAPVDWSQDLSLTVTATTRETANGATATTAAPVLNLVINARPTDIYADRTLTFNENTAPGTGIAWFGRVDGDNDAATFEALSTSGNRWTVRGDGLLSVGSAGLDYESVAGGATSIDVRVTDSGGLSRTETFTINIANVNEAPTAINADRALSFNENLAPNTGLAWFSGSDPEGNISSYSLVDSAGGRYTMRSDGLLSTGSTNIDYEQATSNTIVVRATDAGGLTYDRAFTVGVLNVNDAPVITSSSFTVPESNPGAGAYLIQTGGGNARVLGYDTDSSTPLKYQLVSGDTSVVSVDVDGYLHLQGSLNYEVTRNYSVVARAWDGGAVGAGAYVDRTISIAVSDVNEAPTIDWVPDSNLSTWDQFVGTIVGSDPEGAALSFEILESKQHILQETYTSWPSGFQGWYEYEMPIDVSANTSGQVFSSMGFWYSEFNDGMGFVIIQQAQGGHFIARTRDPGGNVSVAMRVDFWGIGSYRAPVVLDLDGDGFELLSQRDSTAHFSMDDSGPTLRTGWVGADDAFLALDRDGDGVITHGAEISFTQDLDAAASDLEGLSAFDTNGDGSLDSNDAKFGDFLVWQDRNQDGVSQADELRTLNEAGIASLSLLRTLNLAGPTDGNEITATTDFVRLDGSRGSAADVNMGYESVKYQVTFPGDETADAEPDAGEDISTVDRGASAPDAQSASVPQRGGARPITEDPVLPEASQGPAEIAARGDTTGPRRARDQRDRGWDRWSRGRPGRFDEPESTRDEEWQPAAQATPGALHTPISALMRRRLQMIDAMASFAPESSAELALQPHRRVDSRTLELLTSVSRYGSSG